MRGPVPVGGLAVGGLPTSETCLVVPAPVRPRKLKRQRSQVLPATPKESPRSEEAMTFRGHVPLPAASGWRLRASGRKPLCSALCPPHPSWGAAPGLPAPAGKVPPLLPCPSGVEPSFCLSPVGFVLSA